MLVPPSRAHVQIYPSSSEGSRAAHHDAKPCFGGEGDDDGNWVVKAAGRAAPRKISPLRDGQDKIFAGHKKSPPFERASERVATEVEAICATFLRPQVIRIQTTKFDVILKTP